MLSVRQYIRFAPTADIHAALLQIEKTDRKQFADAIASTKAVTRAIRSGSALIRTQASTLTTFGVEVRHVDERRYDAAQMIVRVAIRHQAY
jgi:phosphodiesterase/alkaline phosphatase D-like protein